MADFTTPSEVDARIASALQTHTYTQEEIDQIANSAFMGGATPATVPNLSIGPQQWQATQTGTYANMGGLLVDLTEGVTYLNFDGTTWTKSVAPVELEGYVQKTDYPNVFAIEDDIIRSKNILDNQTVTAGSYNSSGVNSGSVNWISVKVAIKPETTYTISGIGSAGAATTRFIFLNASNAALGGSIFSNATPTQTFTSPVNAAFVLINLANIVNVGLDPTNSIYKDTMMLEEAASATTYEPFYIGYQAEKLVGIDPVIEANPKVAGSSSFIDQIKYPAKNLFDKSLAVSGYIASNGVYVAGDNWCCTSAIAIKPSTSYAVQGFFTGATTVLAIAWYNSSMGFISGEALNGVANRVFASPANAAFCRCTIANAVGIGLTPTDNARSNVFMIEEGTSHSEYEPFFSDPLIKPEAIFGANQAFNPNRKCYYSLDVNGYSGNELLRVFVEISSAYYVGFDVVHWIDATVTIYTNQWRILEAKLYKFDYGSMNYLSLDLLEVGDSEGVYRTANKADFVGGVHGDETVIEVEFFASGVKIDISNDIGLTGCDSFKMLHRSNTHQAPATGNIANPAHPIETLRIKEINFENGGYRIFNRWTWVNTPDKPVVTFYTALTCTHKDAASRGYTDLNFDETVFNGDDTNKMTGVGQRKFCAHNPTNGLATEVTSRVITPANLDAGSNMFIWDRASDSKYYRDLAGNAPDIAGDVIESEMIVKWFRK